MALTFNTFSRVESIDKDVWNGMASGAGPMMEWEYFHALEISGSVSRERGYVPHHLVAYSDHQPVAIAPLYERDRAWVEFGDGGLIEFLTDLTGIPFHHGLVGSIPYTPVPGYQFLHRPGFDAGEACQALLNYIDFLCESRGLSTCRIYFTAMEAIAFHQMLSSQGFMRLQSQHCLWLNENYHTFDDYLSAFRSNRRTKIKRELRTVQEEGISIEMIPGAEASAEHFEAMYQLYVRTWIRHMGSRIRPFLTRSFFEHLADHFRHRVVLARAHRSGTTVGMALFYQKASNLYGRYWGSFEEVPFLHFAVCYYHPIDYAIRHGLRMMDPGFGGEHKLLRGYEIVPVNHYIKFYGEQQKRVARSILEQMQERPGAAI